MVLFENPIALNTYAKLRNLSVVGVAPLLNKATPWIPTQRLSSYSWGCKIHFPPKLYENYHHNYHTSDTLILQLESQTPKTSNDGFKQESGLVRKDSSYFSPKYDNILYHNPVESHIWICTNIL